MKLRIATGLAVAAVAALAVAGCTSPAPAPVEAPVETTMPTETETSAATGTEATTLMTAMSTLGEIVVDQAGMTVYQYDMDTQGAGVSTCTGVCATTWPAVTSASGGPAVEGVTGEVSTITGAQGETQVVLNGWPLYYYSGDTAAGDTNGQGFGGIWWVLTPAGERFTG